MKSDFSDQVRRKKTQSISQSIYDKVFEFIISSIKDEEDGTVEFRGLLDRAEKKLMTVKNGIRPWHVMQVKMDMEKKGIIRIMFISTNQLIKIHPRMRKRL